MNTTGMQQAQVRAEVLTTDYYFSHLRQPRGTGLWMFEAVIGNKEIQFSCHGSYTQARTQAISYYKDRAAAEDVASVQITVLP